jgi:hypothetical protein
VAVAARGPGLVRRRSAHGVGVWKWTAGTPGTGRSRLGGGRLQHIVQEERRRRCGRACAAPRRRSGAGAPPSRRSSAPPHRGRVRRARTPTPPPAPSRGASPRSAPRGARRTAAPARPRAPASRPGASCRSRRRPGRQRTPSAASSWQSTAWRYPSDCETPSPSRRSRARSETSQRPRKAGVPSAAPRSVKRNCWRRVLVWRVAVAVVRDTSRPRVASRATSPASNSPKRTRCPMRHPSRPCTARRSSGASAGSRAGRAGVQPAAVATAASQGSGERRVRMGG